jgi:hypothetical protein
MLVHSAVKPEVANVMVAPVPSMAMVVSPFCGKVRFRILFFFVILEMPNHYQTKLS